jgi:hypothetical protein
MFGRSKPVVFDSYGHRRARRVPRWLVLLVTGIVIGAGGVLLIQARYLPPRMSASESAALVTSFEQVDAERLQLKAALDDTARQLAAANAESRQKSEALAASSATIEGLRADVLAVVDSLPPDPRGAPIAVRAASFSVQDGALAYDVVLSRERSGGKPFEGVMQLIVSGQAAGGSERAVPLAPVSISVGRFESVRGSLPLPEGFSPRQTTIHVLDRPDGKRYGMRVIRVQ